MSPKSRRAAADDADLPPLDAQAAQLATMQVGTIAERDRAAAVLLADDNGNAVLRHIREQAQQPQRSAQWATLYAEIVGWIGTKHQVIALLMSQLGVGISEAQDAVRQIQQVPQDPHEIARMCRNYLAWYDGPNGPGGHA